MIEKFRTWLCSRGRGRSADQYVRVVRRWLDDPRAVERGLTSGELSPNYRRHLAACLRAWAQFSADEALLARLRDMRLPPAVPSSVREPLGFEEWVAVRAAIDVADYLGPAVQNVCGLIALRGLRCGDVLRLRRIDLERAVTSGNLVFEAKGERWLRYSSRPLLPHLKGLLACSWAGRRRVRNLVSPGSSEERSQSSAGRRVRRAFDGIARELGMEPGDLYAHRFRHTYSLHFLQQMQGDPEAVFKLQTQMGWARLDTAMNYLRGSRRDELDEIEWSMLDSEKTNVEE